ncbi:MAG: 5-fold beta-flower protein [Bacteroidota bacterium]
MKTLIKFFILSASIFAAGSSFAQNDYKHPYLNGTGNVVDSTGTKLGWITKEGVIYDAKGEKVGTIVKQELFDYKGHRLGTMGKDGKFKDNEGKTVFYIDATSKGEHCKVFDPNGKVIATVHENYKNQACAIHCLTTKMPAH